MYLYNQRVLCQFKGGHLILRFKWGFSSDYFQGNKKGLPLQRKVIYPWLM